MYNDNDIKRYNNFPVLTSENYEKNLFCEYDFQMYIYYALRLLNYKIYIDRDIRKMLKGKFPKQIGEQIISFNTYNVIKDTGNKVETGRPDFILDIGEFYSEEVIKRPNFCKYIALECKFPDRTKMNSIFNIREQIDSFNNTKFVCNNDVFEKPLLFLTTPLMFFEDIEKVTEWFGSGDSSYKHNSYRDEIIDKINETVIQCLHGMLGVGLFGKINKNEFGQYKPYDWKYGIHDMSRINSNKYFYKFK